MKKSLKGIMTEFGGKRSSKIAIRVNDGFIFRSTHHLGWKMRAKSIGEFAKIIDCFGEFLFPFFCCCC